MDCISTRWEIKINGSLMYRIAKNLDFVKNNLKKWNRESFGHIFAPKILSFRILTMSRRRFRIRVF
jgi:hypothetical protein